MLDLRISGNLKNIIKRKMGLNMIQEIKKSFNYKNKLNLLTALLSVVLLSALNIATAFLFKALTDTAISGTLEDLVRLIGYAGIFLVLYTIVTLIKRKFLSQYIKTAIFQYKNRLVRLILNKNINAFNGETTSKYISLLTNDIQSVEGNFVLGNINIFNQVLLLIGGFGAMIYLNWVLTVVVLISAIIPIIVTSLLGDKLAKKELEVSDRNESFVGLVNDIFKGFSVIKSFKVEAVIHENFFRTNSKLEKIKRERREMAQIVNLMAFVASFIVTLIVCAVGAYLSIKGLESFGTVVAFIQLLDYIVNPIQELGVALPNRKGAIELINKASKAVLENSGDKGKNKELFEFKEAICFSELGFSFEEAPVLNNINLCIEKGKSYMIVGQSGSGKTTLLNMLLGYYNNYTGKLCIDGVEVRDLSRESLYSLFSVIQQNVYVFDDTIEANISLYKKFDKKKIESVIEKAGLSNLVKEKGLDYKCGENGCNLSGGEKQRISIARGLLSDSSILLIDEATAALDEITAEKVITSVLDIVEMTRLIVTHKLKPKVLQKCDGIIVLKNGIIEDVGMYDELYDKKGYFYSLINISN